MVKNLTLYNANNSSLCYEELSKVTNLIYNPLYTISIIYIYCLNAYVYTNFCSAVNTQNISLSIDSEHYYR